jgi:glutamyl-tRNA synthetase
MAIRKVRVRFAPSPTGPLHIGGVRTALFNYLFARRQGGDFILRIEDTDSGRLVPGAEEYIVRALAWCNILPSEGLTPEGRIAEQPDARNPHAPYRQSQRKALYRKYAEQLVESGHAYYAFDTPDTLDALRKEAEARHETFIYNHAVRARLQTSLAMPAGDVAARLQRERHWVVRFKMPESREVRMHDLVRGDVTVNTATLDDKVLWKAADALPTYHLANIVDDHLMDISHVIRGEEWLPSLPLHYLLYEAFGWTDTQPEFAHLPLLLKPDGKGKLSKRDGDRLGFPVFPLAWHDPQRGDVSRGYREDGYFPEAVVNLLALLGWNPGTDRELFSLDELAGLFGLDRVIKSGAKFNPDKARWFNQQVLRMKSDEELAQLYQEELRARGIAADDAYVAQVCGFIKDRATFVQDFWALSAYFFEAPTSYEEKAVRKYWTPETSGQMAALARVLEAVEPFTAAHIEAAINTWIKNNNLSTGAVMNAFRLCIVGAAKGPGMFEISALLGKKAILTRMNSVVLKKNAIFVS